MAERPSEFALIAELFAPLATAAGAFALKDDAAIATPPAGFDLIVTTDALVQGVHFLSSDPPELIAKKALRVNLSDLAAKGCTPTGYVMALSMPTALDMNWLRAFADGLAGDQREFSLSLLGGDTTSTPGPLTIAITAFGHVPEGQMLQRRGAQAGDLVFVSGTIGDAGAGLVCLKDECTSLSAEAHDYLVNRFQLPQPRLVLGKSLIGIASACLDVSDGLIADLGHIADVSGVQVVVDAARIPISEPLRSSWRDKAQGLVEAATAGDDYEIAFTTPPGKRGAVARASAESGIPVAEIGCVTTGQGVVLLAESGNKIAIARGGYTHF